MNRGLEVIYPPMRLGAVAFVVGVAGALFGFSIDYGPDNPWSYVAFAIVAAAVFTGFVSVIWGWVRIFRNVREQRNETRL